MKKFIAFVLSLLFVCLAFAACGKDNVEDVVTDPDTGEIINTATDVVTTNKSPVVQPENALKQVVPGMTICYLDYIVEDGAFLDYVSAAVTPVIIQSPKDFSAFFATEEKTDEVAKANALFDEMTKTEEGKSLYKNIDFYDSWNLIVLSVREMNSHTLHEIESVSYSSDSCIFFVNATRDVAEGEGDATVRHYVFRVPKNVYNGVSHSFKKVAD